MRNKYPGTCYRCGLPVTPGDGHFERHQGSWRVQHAACAIVHREASTTKLKRQQAKAGRHW